MPKPLHGWREFLGEIGIIVIGVLIALFAEQAIEVLHGRRQAAEARDELGVDLAQSLALIQERRVYGPCLARRIEDIAGILSRAARTGRLPPVGKIGQPSIRSYSLPSWVALTASGLGSRLPREQFLSYSQLALAGEEITNLNRAELQNWADLYTIVGPGRSVSPEELGQLHRQLSEAAYRAKLIGLWAKSFTDDWQASRLPIDKTDWKDLFQATWTTQKARIKARPICQPLGPAPATYGQSAMDGYSLDHPE